MLYGGRSQLRSGPTPVDGHQAAGAGAHIAASSLPAFAYEWGLQLLRPQRWTVQGLAQLLAHRPVWAGAYRPNGHAMVLAGMLGDGSDAGTFLTVLDPWPPETGSIDRLPFSVWAGRYSAGSMYILHRPFW
jgi:hypothetical protein